jgi:DNA-binding beta-propeller fold protein YncE
VISSAGDLALYGADAKIAGKAPSIDLTDAESLAISPDGAHIAVIHNGNATVFDDHANFRTFIPATKQPKPTAVAFAGNDYVVTRTPSEARVWRLRSTDRRDLTPDQRWSEWRKMFGLAGTGVLTAEDLTD